MSKHKKISYRNSNKIYFNGLTKEQHNKNLKNVTKGSEWSLREVGYLGLITLCEY